MRDGGQVETLVEINPGAGIGTFPVSQADTSLQIASWDFDRMGYWQGIVRSAEARTPADTLAPELPHEENFATVPSEVDFCEASGAR